MENQDYERTIRVGDVVRMPDGHIGIINGLRYETQAHAKEITVYPFVSSLQRFRLSLAGKLCFYDGLINRLEPLQRVPRT